MSQQIQVPEPINLMPDVNHNMRHIRKWGLLIGIPLLIVAIIVIVYFYNQTSRQSASQTLETTSNSSKTKITPANPLGSAFLLPDQNAADLPGQSESVASFRARFEAINKGLAEYDEIFTDLKVSGTCFKSSQENLVKHASWALGLNILLDETIPDIGEAQKSAKYKELKQLNQEYTQNIKGFIESENKIYQAWFETKKSIFKICDSPIDQIEANCKETPGIIDNYKKLLVQENNKDLFSSLDKIIEYCVQAPNLVKTDNDIKFNELNNSFQKDFARIVSTYPNIGDKTKIIKELQGKVKVVLEELAK